MNENLRREIDDAYDGDQDQVPGPIRRAFSTIVNFLYRQEEKVEARFHHQNDEINEVRGELQNVRNLLLGMFVSIVLLIIGASLKNFL